MMRAFFALLVFLCLPLSASSQDYGEISGLVRDVDTGAAMEGLRVDVYASGEYDTPVASSFTDSKGRYFVNVSSGRYYDAYLRYGESNPSMRTPEAVRGGRSYELNFNIKESSNLTEVVVEKYGIWVVVLVAVVVLGLFASDVLFSKKRPKKSLQELKKERDDIKKVLDISHEKYLGREIDEETFRGISKDKQERLIEIESSIRDMEGGR